MAFNLIIEPNTPPLSRKEFCAAKKGPAIALDGYVSGGPFVDEKGPHLNFNHHERVNRLATRATCGQVLLAIRQGLFQFLADISGEPHADAYVDDCDEDCCTSWTLLNHREISEDSGDVKSYKRLSRLDRLVHVEDLMDSTAGTYCFSPDAPIIRRLGWVFEPYRDFRLRGGLDGERNADEFRNIIDEVEKRILRYVNGRGRSIILDTRYERIGGGENWVMVREIGMHARTGIFADGIRAYVSVRERDDGRFSYVVARMSSFFIHYPIHKFCRRFNAMEQCHKNRWGGSHICIGSPRANGSSIPPRVLEKEMNHILKKEFSL